MNKISAGEPPEAWLRAVLDFILMDEPEEYRTRMVPSPPVMPPSPLAQLVVEAYRERGDSPDLSEDR